MSIPFSLGERGQHSDCVHGPQHQSTFRGGLASRAHTLGYRSSWEKDGRGVYQDVDSVWRRPGGISTRRAGILWQTSQARPDLSECALAGLIDSYVHFATWKIYRVIAARMDGELDMHGLRLRRSAKGLHGGLARLAVTGGCLVIEQKAKVGRRHDA